MGEASTVIDSSSNSGSESTKSAVDALFDLVLGWLIVRLAICGALSFAGRNGGSSVAPLVLPRSLIDSCSRNSKPPKLAGRLKNFCKRRAKHLGPRTADADRVGQASITPVSPRL